MASERQLIRGSDDWRMGVVREGVLLREGVVRQEDSNGVLDGSRGEKGVMRKSAQEEIALRQKIQVEATAPSQLTRATSSPRGPDTHQR